MASSLIRGKYVVAKVTSRTEAHVIPDGAVFQRDGAIVEVGPYADLLTRHRPDDILGSPNHIVVPGFVNGHHHVGLTPQRRVGSGRLHLHDEGGDDVGMVLVLGRYVRALRVVRGLRRRRPRGLCHQGSFVRSPRPSRCS